MSCGKRGAECSRRRSVVCRFEHLTLVVRAMDAWRTNHGRTTDKDTIIRGDSPRGELHFCRVSAALLRHIPRAFAQPFIPFSFVPPETRRQKRPNPSLPQPPHHVGDKSERVSKESQRARAVSCCRIQQLYRHSRQMNRASPLSGQTLCLLLQPRKDTCHQQESPPWQGM